LRGLFFYLGTDIGQDIVAHQVLIDVLVNTLHGAHHVLVEQVQYDQTNFRLRINLSAGPGEGFTNHPWTKRVVMLIKGRIIQ